MNTTSLLVGATLILMLSLLVGHVYGEGSAPPEDGDE